PYRATQKSLMLHSRSDSPWRRSASSPLGSSPRCTTALLWRFTPRIASLLLKVSRFLLQPAERLHLFFALFRFAQATVNPTKQVPIGRSPGICRNGCFECLGRFRPLLLAVECFPQLEVGSVGFGIGAQGVAGVLSCQL